ncbi:hypothetical protein ACLOJK_025410 [Asimina triloba]
MVANYIIAGHGDHYRKQGHAQNANPAATTPKSGHHRHRISYDFCQADRAARCKRTKKRNNADLSFINRSVANNSRRGGAEGGREFPKQRRGEKRSPVAELQQELKIN